MYYKMRCWGNIMTTLEEFEEYFKDDLAAIDEELAKSKQYSAMIDEEIEKIHAASIASGGALKGSQRYLIEHIKNAVALQTQRQSLRKDKFTIRKTILDYDHKNSKNVEGDGINIQAEISKLIAESKKSEQSTSFICDVDLDSAIDEIIKNQE